jgi:hypothetical protein
LNDYIGEIKDKLMASISGMDLTTGMISISKTPVLALPKSVYGLETDPKKTPFGMLNGQIRANGILNNAGDISMKDMEKIANGLNANECFFVLSEFDTIWNMPKDMSANEPGKDYVLKHCAWSISRSSILKVRDTTTALKSETATSSDGVGYTKVGRTAFEKVITTLFYAKAVSGTKHALPPNTKTDNMDAVIKSNLSMLQKFSAQKPIPATPFTASPLAGFNNAPVAATPVAKPVAKPAPAIATTTPIAKPASVPQPKTPINVKPTTP